MMNRRNFLRKSTTSLLSIGLINGLNLDLKAQTNEVKAIATGENQMRVIAYNIFNGAIGFKGINGKALPEGEDSDLVREARSLGQVSKRIAFELELYHPDIINFSESAEEAVVKEIAEMLEMNYVHFPSGIKRFPGSILTKYEIVSSQNRPFVNKKINNPQELFTRHWEKAILRLPNGDLMAVHSAHLWPFRKEENDTTIRMREIEALLASIRADLKNGVKSVLLQGDLNHKPDTAEYERLNDGLLLDTFKAVGEGEGATYTAINPTNRIDYIYAAGDIAQHAKYAKVLYEGAFRMNNEDPRAFSLSDHLPVLVDFAW